MLDTRNAYQFRKFYKEEIARESSFIDLNFIASLHPDKKRRETGFAKLIYGNREDLGKLLGTIALNVAADDQAIYELIQNADDCKSSFFSVSYDENYLLCINNGNYFSDLDMSAIINVAGNYKEGEDIGTFGIGFKILHRLVGTDDGREAIINDYAGPIIFSWSKFSQLNLFLNDEEINVGLETEKDSENPWLVKLLYTCFPSHLDEKLKLQDYETEDVKFSKSELFEMRTFLKQSLQNVNLTETNNLCSGSIFFLKLGKGKNKFLDDGIDKIKSGLSYSFKFLNSLQKIYINGEEIKAQTVIDYSNSFLINSQEFIEINPKNKNRDIKFTFAFYRDYKKAADLRNELAPNLYTFFSMDEEKNGFSFLLHCNAFDMNNDRRKLQANSQINEKLLPIIARSLINYTDSQKEINRNLFLSLYANLLLSKEPKNKPHIDNSFYKFIRSYLSENIPTKSGVSDNIKNVKINKLKLSLDLADFGLNHIQWFEWDNEADKLLIDEAIKSEKLGIKEWDIRDIVENANLESIQNWIASCDKETYNNFLKELEESYLRKETKERISQIKLFRFSNSKFYSFNEVVSIKDRLGKTSFKFNNCFFSSSKTRGVKDVLIKLECVVSELSVEDYPTIFASATQPEDKKLYELIAEKCKSNSLTAQDKKRLFLNFMNEATKFDNVAEGTLKDLHLFCDSNSQIKPLNKLINCKLNTPSWLNAHKILSEEFFPELQLFLISEHEAIFKEIYLPKQDIILADITEVQEIKSLIKLYQDNQKQFFKEFIIKKTGHSFSIAKRKSNTYQVQTADPEARSFIDKKCANNLFVLPHEFLSYKDDDGIIKADDLHNLILDFVDVNAEKETLVDIVKYKAKYKFLQKLSEFRFNSTSEYTREAFEYKILDLACGIELKESDYQGFKVKVIIETESQNLKLSEIPPFTDKIKIEDCDLSLAKILPSNYGNSDHLSNLIDHFIGLGLSNERIGLLFGVSEEPEPSDIYKMFSEQVEILENAEQLAFLFLYGLCFEKIDFNQFKAINVEEEDIYLGTDKYLTGFDFIKQSEILHQKFRGITKIFKEFPIKVEDNDNLLLIKEPYFEDDKFVCPYIKENLSNEEKVSLVEFLFNQWDKKNKKIAIKNIDWSKIKDTETEGILGFNPVTSVYPSKYACQSEILPDYLIKWIGKDESKIYFLADLGVWIERSVVIDLRKYLSGKSKDFHNNRLAQETRFNEDETLLFNSFKWVEEKNITFSTSELFETATKVVEIINANRGTKADLIIQDEYDFEHLKEHSTEWKKTEYQSICLYNGKMPKIVRLDEIDDYIFYRYTEDDFAIGEKVIYLNSNEDKKKTLQKIASDDENEFTFEDMWDLFGESSGRERELEKELTLLKQQVAKAGDAKLSTDFSDDISKNDQKEANREAKEIVKQRLEDEGYNFTKGLGAFSTINGVMKEETEFPLVVKSYKYQDEPLKIGANEWIQLMRPNSMFWVHFGNRKLGCLKLYELLKNQDKLTLSFSTENLDKEDRLENFAEILHYFKNVHFDFNSIAPGDYSVAKDLNNYRFDERSTEEDLSGDDDNLL
jgi:hypothetical protein